MLYLRCFKRQTKNTYNKNNAVFPEFVPQLILQLVLNTNCLDYVVYYLQENYRSSTYNL